MYILETFQKCSQLRVSRVRVGRSKCFKPITEAGDIPIEYSRQQRFLGREGVSQATFADARLGGDLVERQSMRATVQHDVMSRVEDAIAIDILLTGHVIPVSDRLVFFVESQYSIICNVILFALCWYRLLVHQTHSAVFSGVTVWLARMLLR